MTRDRLASFQFRNFELRLPNLKGEEAASLQSAFRAAANYAEDPSGFLTLMGDSGCGKTHLAAAIANKVLAAGESVAFVFVPDLLDLLRSGNRPGSSDESDDLLATIRAVDLLVLDDLAAHSATPWAAEKLFQIVNYRSLGARPTVVTVDCAIDQIGQPRMATRLSDPQTATTVFINAPHYTLGRQPAPEPGRPRAHR